jgi:predicted Zn-dependent protease
LAYAAALLEENNQIRLVDAPAWNWSIDEIVIDIEKFLPELIVEDFEKPHF